uniref:cDNA PSEC0187 fis, clone HEMBA1000034, highly similar to Rat pot. G protein coupled receptor (RTA) mRNA n=1 Tax=Homo sapiens TaxID=9606 RepID=Q8N2G2_HUMAN|nr:unnamed protein product [Homo sapiens]
MAGNCSWEAHPGNRNKMCPGLSEAPELYSRGFLTIEQIAMLPPPAVMNYIFLLLCLCGLVGNGLVLWFFGFSIKRNPFSIYLGIDWFLFWVFQIPAPFPEYVTDLCICINSSAKPIVYFLAGRDKSQRLWEPLRVVFQRALRDGAELGEAGGSTPNTVTMEMQCPPGNAS